SRQIAKREYNARTWPVFTSQELSRLSSPVTAGFGIYLRLFPAYRTLSAQGPGGCSSQREHQRGCNLKSRAQQLNDGACGQCSKWDDCDRIPRVVPAEGRQSGDEN